VAKREFFIERGTNYQFAVGKLSIYETNCPCKGIEFNFDQYVITLMLDGHKTITNAVNKVEFFPGTIFIPEKEVIQSVEIANATYTNPTRCLVLEVQPTFLEDCYLEYRKLNGNSKADKDDLSTKESLTRFFSNDSATIEAFLRFYKYTKRTTTRMEEVVNRNILKELLFRLFQTDAKQLLLANLHYMVKDRMIEQVMKYIQLNLTSTISIDELVEIAKAGKTKLFARFKQEVGLTPVQYIMKERIKYAEKLINKAESLQSVAFQSGFNTYEHFYSSFKKIKGISPMKYKKQHGHRALVNP